jgi:Cu/Ag efflux protein CusF
MKRTLVRAITAASLIAVALAFAIPAGAEEAKKEAKPAKPMKHEYTGDIKSIDVAKKTLTVLKKEGDEKTFVVAEKAKIILKGKEAAELSDLKVGDKVTLSYTEEGGALHAHRIVHGDVMKKEKKAAEKK